MKIKSYITVLCATFVLPLASRLIAQDLGPEFQKIKDGIYVYAGKKDNSNCGIVLTREGIVLIDSGHTPTDSRAILAAVKKLSPLPVRFLLNTETHPDHTMGNFLFSPPAIVINHEGASEGMKNADKPETITKLAQESAEMREAIQGYRLVTPQIEYRERLTLKVGERTFQLLDLKNLHSDADTAVWLPEERVLFAASIVVPNSRKIIRPPATIPDMVKAIKLMHSLQPEIVIPGHGLAGTTSIFDDAERYYVVLLDRVGKMAQEGKSLDQIKQELHLSEYDSWANPDRIANNIEAAYRTIKENK